MAVLEVTAFVKRSDRITLSVWVLCVSACMCMGPDTQTWPRCPHFWGEIQGFSGKVFLSVFFLSVPVSAFFSYPYVLFALSIWPYSSGWLAERVGSKLWLAEVQLVQGKPEGLLETGSPSVFLQIISILHCSFRQYGRLAVPKHAALGFDCYYYPFFVPVLFSTAYCAVSCKWWLTSY